MLDPIVKLIVMRTILLVLAAALVVLSSGCKNAPPPAPALEHGQCEPAEYTRGVITAKRCTHEGRVWRCQLAGEQAHVCTLLAVPAEAPIR